jgi:amphi-Trp domain-containing protein
MSGSKKAVNLKGRLEREKVISYLEDLVSCMRAGTVSIQDESQSIVLKPHDVVELEIRASHKDHKESISIDLAWRNGEENHSQLSSMKITAVEPKKKTSPDS